MNRPLPLDELLRVGFFIAVGAAAAAVHWCVVVGLVGHLGWQPQIANVVGWLTAFPVSFMGHQRLTFSDRATPLLPTALRFFGLSAAGFAINEAAYVLLLRAGVARYDVALAAVLIGVALATFLLSRGWAFAHPRIR